PAEEDDISPVRRPVVRKVGARPDDLRFPEPVCCLYRQPSVAAKRDLATVRRPNRNLPKVCGNALVGALFEIYDPRGLGLGASLDQKALPIRRYLRVVTN